VLRVPTYDIEAIDWINPIAVGLFDGINYREFLQTSDEDDVIWKFLEYLRDNLKGIRLYAHNAAKYDAKFILAKLQEKKEPIRMEAGLFRLVWLRARVTFEDSYVALPGSLRALSEGFGVSQKLEWEHEDTEYPWVMNPQDLDSFRAYLKRDCLSLSEVMEKYCEKLLTSFKVTPSLTLALTAMKAFDKNYYPVKKIDSNEKFEKQIRLATFGGRNEVYKRYGENLNFYDVRSMFMSCYDVPVPIGRLLWTTPNIDTGTLARAKVKVPTKFYIGPLPVRYRGRLTFPVGEFIGWWDTRWLKFAAELGCDILILQQLRADEEPILKEFAEDTYAFRVNSTKEIESRLWKLFGLRLSGKFGQSRWQSRIVHTNEIKDYTGSYPMDVNEEYHEFTEYISGHRAPYIKPAISMRIRSEAGIRHTKLLLEALSRGEIYYCDTDSIVTSATLPIGKALGELQLVNKALRGYFIQCKFYGYVSPMGILHQTSAGFRDFRLDEEDFEKLLDGKVVDEGFYPSLSNWREVLKKASVRKINRHRRISSTLGFRNRRQLGKDTRPLVLSLKS